MATILARRPRACAEHPHRPAADRCDHCRRPFCPDCLVRGRPELLCLACWASAPEREARAVRHRHPVYRRLDALRANRPSVVAGAVIVGTLAVLFASAAAQVVAPAYTASVGEAVRAVRRGVPGGAPPPGTATVAGATRVPTLLGPPCCSPATVAEFAPGEGAAALFDGRVGPDSPAWRSPAGFPAPELRLPARTDVLAGRVLFAHSAVAPPETWAKEVEAWVALTPDATEAIRVGRWTLAASTEPQTFAFPPARVAQLRVRVLSNHGGTDSTSLAEVALLSPG